MSCLGSTAQILGHWIGKDNFQNPLEIEFSSFSMKYNLYDIRIETLYHIEKDTFYTSSSGGLNKALIKFSGDEFSLTENDSTVIVFERNNYSDLLSFFNFKQKTSIELPNIKSVYTKVEKLGDLFFVDKKNDSLRLFVKDHFYLLSDTLFELLNKFSEEEASIKSSFLYISKELKVSEINAIKQLFQKAKLYRIRYVVKDQDFLRYIQWILPPCEDLNLPNPYSKTWLTQKEPFYNKNILCYITSDFCLLNSDTITREELKVVLMKKIEKKPKCLIHIYFDANLSFEDYLGFLYSVQQCFFEIRNNASKSEYGGVDFDHLDEDIQSKIRIKYPMTIREIDKNEYNLLKKRK